MRVPSLVLSLLLLSFPAIAAEQPVSTPEIDAIQAYGPLLAETNGRDFVVAWTYDGRVSRVNAAGNLLDPVGIAVPAADIASNGEDYLLVGPCEQLLPIVCLSRLQSGDGSVTTLATFDGYSAALAWDGSRFLLVVAPPAEGSNLQGLFLDRNGAPQSQPFTIPLAVTLPRVASDGHDFLVVGKPHGTGHLRGALVRADADTSVIPGFIHLANLPGDEWVTHAIDHQVESDGSGFLVSWNTFVDYDAPLRAFVREVTREGAPAGPAREIGTGRGALTHLSSGYLTLLGAGEAVNAIGLGSDGAPTTAPTLVAEGGAGAVAIVRGAQSSLAVWSDSGDWPFEPVAFFELLDASHAPQSAPRVLSNGLRSQEQVAASWGVDSGLVARVEPRGPWRTRRIVAGRVDDQGRPLDGPGNVVWDSGGDQGAPSIEFNGVNYLMTWSERTDVVLGRSVLKAARVSSDGRMLDASPILVDDQWPHAPLISWNGVTWVLVWGRSDGTLMSMAIYPSGVTAAPQRIVATPPEGMRVGSAYGDIAWDGEKHVVLFVFASMPPSGIMAPPPRRDLYTVTLDSFGVPLSSHELIRSSSITGTPKLVWTGAQFVAAWSAIDVRSSTGLWAASLAQSADRFLVEPRRVLDFELVLSGLAWDGANVVAAATVPNDFRTQWAVLGATIDPRTLTTWAHFIIPDGRAEGVLVPLHAATRLVYTRMTERDEAVQETQRAFTIEYEPKVRRRPVVPSF